MNIRTVAFVFALWALIAVAGCGSTPGTVTEGPLRQEWAGGAEEAVEIKPIPEAAFSRTLPAVIPETDLDYRVGPRDVISIIVYGEKDLSVDEMMITSDGFISMPLIGRMSVDNLTVTEIEGRIAKLLADGYLVNPQVMVTVKSFVSRNAIILGAVATPGSYPLKGRFFLLELISQAGGILSESAGSDILIWRTSDAKSATRGENEREQVIRIGTERLLKEGDMRLNVPILDRDVVFVPEAEHIYIIGEVRKPGSIRLQRDRITALEAITMAGGFTPIAASNRTRIIRVTDGVEQTIPVPVRDVIRGERSRDVVLMPGDVIVVPESLF